MMENYERTIELVNVAQDSQGRSDEQFAKYANTMTYKINQLKNSWEELRISFLDSTDYKDSLDFLNAFLNKMKEIDPKMLLIDIGVFAFIGGNIINGIIKSLREGTPKISQALGDALNIKNTQFDRQIEELNRELRNKINIKLDSAGIQWSDEIDFNKENATNLQAQVGKLKEIETEEEKIYVQRERINQELNKTLKNGYGLLNSTENQKQKVYELVRANQQLSSEQLQQLIVEKEGLYIGDGTLTQLKSQIIEEENIKNKLNEQVLKRKEIEQYLIQQGFNEEKIANLKDKELVKIAQQVEKEKQITQQKQKQLVNQKKLFSGKLGNIITSAVTTGLSTAILTGISTGDWTEAFKTGLSMGMSTLIPSIINLSVEKIVAILPAVLPALLSPVGLGIATIISASIIPIYVNSINFAEKDSKKRLKNIQKELKDYQSKMDKQTERYSESKAERDQYKEERESLKELQETYEEYNKERFHTQEEQEEYQKKLQEYAETYPNLIQESNNNYSIQTSLLRDQLDLTDEKYNKAEQEYTAQKLITAEYERQQELLKYQETLAENDVKRKTLQNDIADSNSDFNLSKTAIADNIRQVGLAYLDDEDLKEIKYKDYNIETIFNAVDQISNLDEKYDGIISNFLEFDFSKIKNIDEINENNFKELATALRNFYNIDLNELANVYTKEYDKLDEDARNKYKDSYEEYLKITRESIRDSYINQGIDSNLAEYFASQADLSELYGMEEDEREIWIKDYIKNSKDQIKEAKKYKNEIDLINSLQADLSKNDLMKFAKEQGIIFNKDGTVANEDDLNNKQQFLLSYIQREISRWESSRDAALEANEFMEQLYGDFSEYGADTINQITNQFSQFADGVGQKNSELFDMELALRDSLIDTYKLSNKEAMDLLNSVDFTSLDFKNYNKEQENFIKKAEEFNISRKEAQKDFEQIANQFEKNAIIDIVINPDEVDDYISEVEEKFENLQLESIYSLTQMQNGAVINASELEELQEWASQSGQDWRDYYDLTTGTLKQVNKLQEAYNNSIDSHFGSLLKTISQIVDGTKYGEELFKTYEQYQKGLITRAQLSNKFEEEEIAYAELHYESWNRITDLLNKELAAAMQKQINSSKEYYESLKDVYDTASEAEENLNKAQQEEVKKIQDAQDKINNALQNVAEQEDAILEKEKDIVEKTNELNEALYGTSNYLSSRDSLQNYTDRIDQLAEKTERAKEALDNPEAADDISELVKIYGEAIHQEMVYQQALNRRKEDQKNQILGYLQNFGSQYFTMVDGYLQANYSAIDNAQMNDQLKDQIYSYLDSYNEVQKEIIEGEQKYSDLLKEMKDRRKDALDSLVDLQKNTADILEESYKKEIEDVKNKYDAIKEADDDYLSALEDAINKQRNLREQESQWNDLATKEKKLSLMQRDTSGAYQKDSLQLEKEIQEDRQSLLDSSIDNIIDTLKETYEGQQKAREEEVQYQEQVLENMNFMKQAIELLNSMGSNEDYLSWLMQTDTAYLEGSEYEQEQYLLEHENDFSALQAYQDLTNSNFQNYLIITTDEVNQAMQTTSDNMNEYLERSHQNVLDKVYEEQNAAQEALDQSYAELDESILKLNELKQAVDEAQLNYTNAVQEAKENTAEAQKAYNDAMKSVYDTGATSIEDMEKKVAAALENYNQVEADAEIKIANLRADYSNYIGMAAETIDLFNQAQTGDELRSRYDQNRIALDSIKEANRIIDQRNAYISSNIGAGTDPDSDIMEGYAQQISAAIGPASQLFNLEIDENGYYRKYAAGGLVNYTGPAWVDGSPSKPEAFLSAEDTARIGAAAELLSNIPFFDSSSITSNSYSSNIGDTTIEVHINVENISSEVDIDEAVKRVEDDIVQMSNSIGNSIYLNK